MTSVRIQKPSHNFPNIQQTPELFMDKPQKMIFLNIQPILERFITKPQKMILSKLSHLLSPMSQLSRKLNHSLLSSMPMRNINIYLILLFQVLFQLISIVYSLQLILK
jgi:hypothetical protein